MKIKTGFENVIFASRWLLVPFYIGLMACLFAMVVKAGSMSGIWRPWC